MKYVCTVCGYIYDEAEQDVPFAELPESWVCPLCGAPKALFELMEEEPSAKAEPAAAEPLPEKNDGEVLTDEDGDELRKLSPMEISALFSNLARGCEKQYQQEAMNCFKQLADYFEAAAPKETEVSFERLAKLVKNDLDVNYKKYRAEAEAEGDRGTLRAIVWGEKVTKMAQSLIDRYNREGAAFLENTNLYICTVCGFMYLGENPPALCPVCKVPGWKFEKVNGR